MTVAPDGSVAIEVDAAGVARLTLCNPAKLNAMSPPMWRTLREALTRFADDAAVRCVVIAGEGVKAFCVGADISRFEAIRSDAAANAAYEELVQGTLAQVQSFPKPTIAAVSGFCLGGGLALAAACDLRLAAAGSRFGIPAARLGIGYFYAGVKRIVDLVGPAQAKRLLFTAERFGADEMLRIGLVDEVVPGEAFPERVAGVAAGIAGNAPLSLKAAKLAVETACAAESARDIEACSALERTCSASSDHAEGRRAFAEKRAPVFHGR